MENYKEPIIGILSQNLDKSAILKKYPHLKGKPYIGASYKRYLESVNCKVLLINCNITEEVARRIYNSINGFLLPGGSASLTNSNYSNIAKLFFKWATTDADENKRWFPIFGICLGFQFLIRQYEEECCLTITETLNYNLPIQFSVKAQVESKLFANASSKHIDVFSKEQVTFNFHKYSLRLSDVSKHPRIENIMKILATSVDPINETEFVAAIEAKHYPFFGVIWHPDAHEDHPVICHSENAIHCSLYLATFFRNECCHDQLFQPEKNYKDFENAVQIYDTGDVVKIKEICVLMI